MSLFSQAGHIKDNSIYSQTEISCHLGLQTRFSQTPSRTDAFLKNTKAFFRQFLWLMVSWTPSEGLQGVSTYCLIIHVSQMSTAAASARSWLVSCNKWLIPPLCQLVVKHIIRGNPKTSSVDARRAVHFYLDGTRNSRIIEDDSSRVSLYSKEELKK